MKMIPLGSGYLHDCKHLLVLIINPPRNEHGYKKKFLISTLWKVLFSTKNKNVSSSYFFQSINLEFLKKFIYVQ